MAPAHVRIFAVFWNHWMLNNCNLFNALFLFNIYIVFRLRYKKIKNLFHIFVCSVLSILVWILLEKIFVLIEKFALDHIVKVSSPIEANIFFFSEKSNKPREQSALQNSVWWKSPGHQGQSFPGHEKTPTLQMYH